MTKYKLPSTDIMGDLFKGHELLRKLEKVSKLTETGYRAQDPRFKRLWLQKATELSRRTTLECSSFGIQISSHDAENKNLNS